MLFTVLSGAPELLPSVELSSSVLICRPIGDLRWTVGRFSDCSILRVRVSN